MGRIERNRFLPVSFSPVDSSQIQKVADLVEASQSTSIQAGNIGLCDRVFQNMLTDQERPVIFLGLAGPLITSGLRKVLRDMIHLFLGKEGVMNQDNKMVPRITFSVELH